jgi:hypothetical protein
VALCLLTVSAKMHDAVRRADGQPEPSPERQGSNNIMKRTLSIFVAALLTAVFASAASAHVVMVTAAIPAASASSDADLEQALVGVLHEAIAHTVAFAPTQVTLEEVRRVGDQIYVVLLIVDADGEQLLLRLAGDDAASSPSPEGTSDGTSKQPAIPTI